MNVGDFDYELAPERIAQQPADRRDHSKLLVVPAGEGAFEHHRFGDLAELLRPRDLLVLNDTRVFPARLIGRKPSGGRVEVLLVERVDERPDEAIWRCLVQSSRKPAVGSCIEFEQGLVARVLSRDNGAWIVRLEAARGAVDELVDRVGRMPLPPYIRRGDGRTGAADRERYQTVYARRPGAIAAPTAGLHFTPGLLAELRRAGIEQVHLTLHVGIGTFLPVRVERVEDHEMHAERLMIPAAVADAVAAARARGGRIVAVGTTVVRALESRSSDAGVVEPGSGTCSLFIYPGYRFRVVDALITNFHLPRSTLLMLVAAFAGRERVLAAYREALAQHYRFYSYGDAMLVGPR